MSFQYKTELHVHSVEVSPCASLTVEEVTERYISEGYTTLMLTNHYSKGVLEDAKGTPEERADHFLAPYRKMKEYAKGRLHILLGCELRFTGSSNDYLIIGADEQFFHDHTDLYNLNLRSFRELADLHGLLIIQAHPFRNGMIIGDPSLLDGVEAFNGNEGHRSRNPIAHAWAEMFDLIPTSGSDFHNAVHNCVAGILTEAPITSQEELMETLKNRDYWLICGGKRAEAEGLSDHPAKK